MKSISIKLIYTPDCEGSIQADAIISELIEELKDKVLIDYSKESVLSVKELSEKEIYGSPTILVNEKDIEFGNRKIPKSLG